MIIFSRIIFKKMQKNYIFFVMVLGLSFSINSHSQISDLFIPREIQTAINNDTRTINGFPGKKYWQNEINYQIEVEFNPETGKIIGKETIRYKNNSPNALYNLIVNLYPNLFKKGNSRDRNVEPIDVHDGITLKKINISGNGVDKKFSTSYFGTHLSINLSKPLYANSEMQIQMEWEFLMQSKTTIRVGKYGKNTWFIGYWYPQIAVYDDIFGWDDIDYDGLHEFYSAFANFDVKIKVPSNQIIWATGIWQNPSEILNPEYFDRYNQALKSDKVIQIVGINDLKNKITKSEKDNIWHYVAGNVADFSFATSDTYLWDGISTVSDKKTKKETFIQTAYNRNSLDFFDVAEISRKTIQYLSDSMPGIPFPYPRMTVFNGGGGMEFPMMVNDRSTQRFSETFNLTSHEISHTYFPFYVGINQERYSWMDEGWAQFLPSEFQDSQVNQNNQIVGSVDNFSYYAGNSLEMPMMIPSFYMKGYEYYISSYYRPEVAYRMLENLLGKQLFKKALQEYISRWNGKYPGPYDFFFTFNDIAGEDLLWFWKPWFFEMAYPDLAIGEIKKTNIEWSIQIVKIGNLPVPIEVKIEYTNNTTELIRHTAAAWKNGKTTFEVKVINQKLIRNITLGNALIPDINEENNRKTYTTN